MLVRLAHGIVSAGAAIFLVISAYALALSEGELTQSVRCVSFGYGLHSSSGVALFWLEYLHLSGRNAFRDKRSLPFENQFQYGKSCTR